MESSVPSVQSDDTSMITDEGNAKYDLGEELPGIGRADLPSTTQTSIPTSGSHCHHADTRQQTPTTSSAKKLLKNILSKKKRCSTTELSIIAEKLLVLNPKNVKYLEQKTKRAQDEDYQFLMRFLPYFSDIPKEKKLSVRQKMMDAVMEKLLQQNSSTATHLMPNSTSHDSSCQY